MTLEAPNKGTWSGKYNVVHSRSCIPVDQAPFLGPKRRLTPVWVDFFKTIPRMFEKNFFFFNEKEEGEGKKKFKESFGKHI